MGKRRNTTRKALRMESLEARQLMAADIGLHHGILNVRGTHQDDVIKMEQVQVRQSNQENSIIKVSVANKRGRVLKAAQFDARAVKKIKAYGLNGHDRIVNGTDIPSYLNGGKGNDVLQGGAAVDQVFGSYGNDTLRGGAGHDKLYGGSGHDRIYGNSGNDYVSGGSGHDRIYGCGGDDVLHGGSGNDLIRGADGKDHLYAGVGRDKLYGDRGQDVLHKSSSRDRASGGQGRDRIKHDAKATSTAAARKVHEASIADSKVEAVKGRNQVESSLGQAKKQVVRRHFPQAYRQHGVTLDQLKKLRSVKPIQQDSQDNKGSKEERAIQANVEEKLNWTKENLHAQAIAERLGLNEEDTSAVHDYAYKNKGDDFSLRDLHLLAGSLLYDSTPEDVEKAGLPTLDAILKAEKARQDFGIEDLLVQLIDEANKELDKDSEPNPNSGRPIDHVFTRHVRKQNDLAPGGDGTVQDALQEAADNQTWGKENIEKLLEGNLEGTQGSDDDPLESLESTEAPQKPAAALGESGLPETDHPTAQDGDPYANGMGNDWDSGPGQDGDGSGKGSNGSWSGNSTSGTSNGSTSSSDNDGSGSDQGSSYDPSGGGSTPVTGGQNNSKPKSDSQSGTEGSQGNGEGSSDSGNDDTTSPSGTDGENESGSGSSATTTTVLGKSENGNTTKFTWMRKDNDTERAVFGETTYTQQEDGTYREEASWFGADSGKKVNSVSSKFEGNSGDSTNSDDGDHAFFGVKICGGGMNPWGKTSRKAPKRIVRNPGNIDPINPNYVDAVFTGNGLTVPKRICGSDSAYTPLGKKVQDSPNSEGDGHTCPTSGDADRSE